MNDGDNSTSKAHAAPRFLPRSLIASCVGFVALLLVALEGGAQDYDAGQAAFLEGKYEKAFENWRPLAEQGDARAQTGLGLMYAKGLGVGRDDERALDFFRLAAEQGFSEAQFYLGFGYRNGLGVPQDLSEAARWFRLAADQGHVKASSALGFLCLTGQGVPKDSDEALKWTRFAATQGEPTAQYNLGLMYAGGNGVQQNFIAAYMWIQVAKANGLANTDEVLERIERELTVGEKIEAGARAKACQASQYSVCD